MEVIDTRKRIIAESYLCVSYDKECNKVLSYQTVDEQVYKYLANNIKQSVI